MILKTLDLRDKGSFKYATAKIAEQKLSITYGLTMETDMKIDGQVLYEKVMDTWCRKCDKESSACKECPVSKFLDEVIRERKNDCD